MHFINKNLFLLKFFKKKIGGKYYFKIIIIKIIINYILYTIHYFVNNVNNRN